MRLCLAAMLCLGCGGPAATWSGTEGTWVGALPAGTQCRTLPRPVVMAITYVGAEHVDLTFEGTRCGTLTALAAGDALMISPQVCGPLLRVTAGEMHRAENDRIDLDVSTVDADACVAQARGLLVLSP